MLRNLSWLPSRLVLCSTRAIIRALHEMPRTGVGTVRPFVHERVCERESLPFGCHLNGTLVRTPVLNAVFVTTVTTLPSDVHQGWREVVVGGGLGSQLFWRPPWVAAARRVCPVAPDLTSPPPPRVGAPVRTGAPF